MKIRYINEAFKKISNLKKDADKTLITDETQHSEVVRILSDIIYDINNDEEFKNKFDFRNVVYIFSTQGFDFIYEGVSDCILNLSVKINCHSNISSINLSANLLKDEKAIRLGLDDSVTEGVFNYCDEHFPVPNIRNIISKVHVNKIILDFEGRTEKSLAFRYNYSDNFVSVLSEKEMHKVLENFNKLVVITPNNLITKFYTAEKLTEISEIGEILNDSNLYKSIYKDVRSHNNEYGLYFIKFKRENIHLYKLQSNGISIDLDKCEYVKTFNKDVEPIYVAATAPFDVISSLSKKAYTGRNVWHGMCYAIRNMIDNNKLSNQNFELLTKNITYFGIIDKNSSKWNCYSYENGIYTGKSKLNFSPDNITLTESFKKISDLKKDIDKIRSEKDA